MTHFKKIREHAIPSLQASVEEYLDPASGARHIHLANAGAEMAFLVAFPTVPDASDGRAHILEHLALCGSQRYPVRDPFFAMMRRSTATFMNAFTYADRTVYPFASTSEPDFFNLLDVYLDAAFFPKLDYLDFLQEGWRHGLEDGKLAYQGVVFNEMKGAFTDPMHALYQGIAGTLLPDTTYAFDSGGDPLVIPELTHAMLKEFHASHYHPSQAIFMTAGPISAEAIQRQIAERVLAQLPGAFPRRVPQLAEIPAAPRSNTVRIPSQEARDNEYGIQLAWLLGESADPRVALDAGLLTAGLLGDAAAPLTLAMETAGYGRPAQLNGHEDNARQMLFHLGMEGLTVDEVPLAQAHMWSALERVAETGVPPATLQAALRDLKYQQRDTRGGYVPNVLERLLAALPVAMREGDVVGAFDNEAVVAGLERDIADPDYFKNLVRGLLASSARLTTTVVPDAAYFTARDEAERARLAEAEAALGDADRARIQAESAALQARQQQPVETHLLPRIRPSDVSPAPRTLQALVPAGERAFAGSIASNGISYANVTFDVSAFPAADWPWLSLYAELRDDLGIVGSTYADAGAWRQRMVPSFSLELRATQSVTGALLLDLAFAASGLREEHANIATVLATYIGQPRFDEHDRLAFLIESKVENTLNGLAQAGNGYAALAAGAPFAPARQFLDATRGAGSLPFIGRIEQLAATAEGLATIAAELARVHAAVVASPSTILAGGSGDDGQVLAGLVAEQVATSVPATTGFAAAPSVTGALSTTAKETRPLANAALHAASQVNHCVIAWATPAVGHEDAGVLAVAAELLTHQALHTLLREEGGAYGGSASYAGDTGVFSMSSYRDPRLAGTYADFQAALDRVLATDYTDEQVEEAIISVIQGLDKPDAPWDGVRAAWQMGRRGVTPEIRQQFRRGVLGCTQDDVKRVVRAWLQGTPASRAAFAGNTEQDLAGLAVVDLLAETRR
ncbi:insulinase family protein [Pseudoduganella lutea]|uniref:Peptidase M16 n=1 Tax=Pseudoduganella lutea TaxID=321985 RepID=A0A4P6KTI7_9BURK|nr:insulinase family protein [Pseudoduganella lutea]QBE62220.1 peptidase M16 [Pseudoduganella lutea]